MAVLCQAHAIKILGPKFLIWTDNTQHVCIEDGIGSKRGRMRYKEHAFLKANRYLFPSKQKTKQ